MLKLQVQQADSWCLVVSSYDTARVSMPWLASVRFLYCVLDEGHIIRNPHAKTSQACKQVFNAHTSSRLLCSWLHRVIGCVPGPSTWVSRCVPHTAWPTCFAISDFDRYAAQWSAMQIVAQHRLLLSGTPIQNNVTEIWGLFDFLMPGFLGTEANFRARFRAAARGKALATTATSAGTGNPGSAQREQAAADAHAAALHDLHQQVLPFVLRRTKDQVLDDLPDKIMQVCWAFKLCQLGRVDDQGIHVALFMENAVVDS